MRMSLAPPCVRANSVQCTSQEEEGDDENTVDMIGTRLLQRGSDRHSAPQPEATNSCLVTNYLLDLETFSGR